MREHSATRPVGLRGLPFGLLPARARARQTAIAWLLEDPVFAQRTPVATQRQQTFEAVRTWRAERPSLKVAS